MAKMLTATMLTAPLTGTLLTAAIFLATETSAQQMFLY